MKKKAVKSGSPEKSIVKPAAMPKIMIIDTHVQSAISLSTILEFNGYRTVQAYNKQDALDLINSEDPDMIIVDLTLDGQGSGCDIAKQLQNKKVILMGTMGISKQSCGLLKNVVGVVEKPVDNSKLVELVKKKA